MKIQTQAILKALTIDGQDIPLDDESIYLEFSAIDTGGGFKDPMLDFSILIEESVEQGEPNLSLTLADPNHEDKEVSFSFNGEVTVSNQQINGRIKEDQLSREIIGFVLNLLR